MVRESVERWNQSVRKGKGLWRKVFAEEPSLKFRARTRCKKLLHLTNQSKTYSSSPPTYVVNSTLSKGPLVKPMMFFKLRKMQWRVDPPGALTAAHPPA